MSLAVVGQRLPRLDGAEKVTGQAQFLADLRLPGLLWGKILHSPHPHARILSIDPSAALALPGVKAVLTGADVPPVKFGSERETPDRQILATDKVRYVGDAVAAVAAVDEATAEGALELIAVEYEPLRAVFDPLAAIEPGAPLVQAAERNIAWSMAREFGDVEQGFRESDEVFEDTYTTQAAAHCCLEPHGCAAQLDRSGRLTLWTSTQKPHLIRESLCKVLGLSQAMIRVVRPAVGGAFGSKDVMEPREPICALLARRTGRPVMMVNTREEEFATSGHRYPMRITLKTGVRREGRIVARTAQVIADNGAYNNQGSIITGNAGAKMMQLYAVPNVRFEARLVYTNKQSGAAFRGFGGPQMHFAMESQLDRIAERLGLDPVAIRLVNANRPNTVTASGAAITSCAMEECIEETARRLGWRRPAASHPLLAREGSGEVGPVPLLTKEGLGEVPSPPPPQARESEEERALGRLRGAGLACMIHGGGGTRRPPYSINFSEAFIKVNDDGTVSVISGESDVGQGSDTVLAQIAAEELGLRLEDVRFVSGDTDVTPLSLGTSATRVTFVGGNAIRMAAAEAKRELLATAAEMLEASVEDLEARDRRISVIGSPDRSVAFAKAIGEHYRRTGRPISARGWYDAPNTAPPDPKTGYGNISPAYTFAAQGAEVAVDPETGAVRLLQFVAAHDVGCAINPMQAEGQVEGAAVQGMGYALTEELVRVQGRTANPSFLDYRLFSALDVPPIQSILVESDDPNGPFGAKGVGEPGLVSTAPAIANALYAATGVRLTDLPMTPEKMLRALKEQASIPSPSGRGPG